jgi:HlyD family secretion protein
MEMIIKRIWNLIMSKCYRSKALIITCFVLFISICNANEVTPLLLTGTVKALDNQTFYAPKTDNWRVEIKWMPPEGEIVKKGELAVVFDSGTIESNIEQEEISLLAAEEELQRLIKKGQQAVLEAKFAVNRVKLLLKKAKIEASIPKNLIIEYDYQKFQVEYEKALVALVKAQDNYKQARLSDQVAVQKQKLTISKHQYSLAYNKKKLSKMALYAQRTGPILYAEHPWNGEKIFVGMTAQASWKIAEIPSLSGLYIETWVHEIDYEKVKSTLQAELSFDAFAEQKFTATLTSISTQPEERKNWGNDVYYKANYTFSGASTLKLLPGMSALLTLSRSNVTKNIINIAKIAQQNTDQTGRVK